MEYDQVKLGVRNYGNYCSTTTFIMCLHGQIDEMKHAAMNYNAFKLIFSEF